MLIVSVIKQFGATTPLVVGHTLIEKYSSISLFVHFVAGKDPFRCMVWAYVT